MPVNATKRITVSNDDIDIVADECSVLGLETGTLSLFTRWYERTPGGAINAKGSSNINSGDDLDENGQGDLAQVWQAARAASGVNITPGQYLDLQIALVQAAAEIKKASDE